MILIYYSQFCCRGLQPDSATVRPRCVPNQALYLVFTLRALGFECAFTYFFSPRVSYSVFEVCWLTEALEITSEQFLCCNSIVIRLYYVYFFRN